MEVLVPYLVWLVIAIVGLSLLAMVVFGFRGLLQGKANPLTIVLTVIPAVILLGLGFATGDWAYAGVMTFVILLVITTVSLLVSGLRGLLNF